MRSRAALFRGIEGQLFSDWAKRRSAQIGAAEISWAKIAPAFRRLALESLKSGKEELTRADIRRHLGQEALDQEQEWIDSAHRRFGLLLLQEVLKQDTLTPQAVFQLARILGPLLQPDQWDTLHKDLYDKLGWREVDWLSNGRDSWNTIRCTDQYAQILFETGGKPSRL